MKLSTPLRYPGGKSKAIKKMAPYFPSGFIEYREPFVGGGSVAIYIAQTYPNTQIWINDKYEPLYNFWVQLRDHGAKMQVMLSYYKENVSTPTKDRAIYDSAKQNLHNHNIPAIDRAIAFYVINRCSFSGSTESGGYSKEAAAKRFTLSGINKLSEYSQLIKRWKITNLDYADLLIQNESVFIYADPPYQIKQSLYGHKGSMHDGFDHERFARHIAIAPTKVMISYNASKFIKDRFNKWNQIEFEHGYSMVSKGSYRTDQKTRNELLLLNYDCENSPPFP